MEGTYSEGRVWTGAREDWSRPCAQPPLIAAPQSVCTLTYVVAGPLESKEQAKSVDSYLRTRFARFLIVSPDVV